MEYFCPGIQLGNSVAEFDIPRFGGIYEVCYYAEYCCPGIQEGNSLPEFYALRFGGISFRPFLNF